MRLSWSAVSGAAVAVVLTVGVTTGPGAQAAPSGGSAVPGVEEYLNPDVLRGSIPLELITLREQVHAQFGTDPGYGISAITGGGEGIEFGWYGEVPAELTELLADVTESGTFAASVRSTEYPLLGLLAEGDRLVEAYGPDVITGIGPRPDGGGLDLTVDPAVVAGLRLPGGLTAEVLGIESVYPLSVTVAEPIMAAGTRLSPTAPFYSGTRIAWGVSGNGGQCTLAWPVTSSAGVRSALTASHCGPSGRQWRGGGTSNVVGNTINENDPTDSAVVAGTNPNGNQFINVVYTGAYNTSTATAYFHYANTTSTGDPVCYSGSFSGLTCGSGVTHPYWEWTFSSSEVSGTIHGMRTYEPPANNADTFGAVGNGDSGGPGFIPARDANGNTVVVALSVISGMENGINSAGACQGVSAGGGRACSKVALATYASEAAASMGYTL